MHIACAVEGDYVPHSAAMLHSVLEHSPRGTHVTYMYGPELDARPLDRMAAMVEDLGASVSFLVVGDERCEGLPTRGFTGKATWYKLFLPELLPDSERVLYLDSDLLALDSLEPLWRTDLDGHYLAAVSNVLPPLYRDRASRLGMSDPSGYFNAGVLLLNLDAMRRDGRSRAMYEFGVANADDLVLRDQDVMNVVLGERRLRLHPRWNCMNAVLSHPEGVELFGADVVEEARRDPAIRHFEGPDDNKPWHFMCRQPSRAAYKQHRSQTPWPRYWREGLTPANLMRRLYDRPPWRS